MNIFSKYCNLVKFLSNLTLYKLDPFNDVIKKLLIQKSEKFLGTSISCDIPID